MAAARLRPEWQAPGVTLAVLGAAMFTVALAAAGRRLGARHAEPVALWLAPVVVALSVPLGRVGQVLGLAVAPLAGGRGQFSLPMPPLEEMERKLAEYARVKGNPADRTSELIHKVFEFRDKVARDVMVPRTDLVAVDIDASVPEILRLLAEQGHSRIPVYQGSLEQIVGILHARDLVPLLAHPELIVLRDLLRPAHFVPWSKPVQGLLRDMQRRHVHLMMVVDEYGGVMGVVTLEDVLEEIVGDIQDEWDVDEGKAVEMLPDGSFSVRGSTAGGRVQPGDRRRRPRGRRLRDRGGLPEHARRSHPIARGSARLARLDVHCERDRSAPRHPGARLAAEARSGLTAAARAQVTPGPPPW